MFFRGRVRVASLHCSEYYFFMKDFLSSSAKTIEEIEMSKGYAIPKHRCSFCLELIGSGAGATSSDSGVVWLVEAGETPKWLTACYVCLDLVPFDTRQELYGYYSYTRVFTRDIKSIMSAVEHMHKFSFDTPTAHIWNSEVSKTFFIHLGMYNYEHSIV